MAIHKPWDRPFYVLGGSVMTDGFSLNLAEGQFGIFNVSKQTPKGSVAVSAFNGVGKNDVFELKLGNKQKLTRSTSNKVFSSFPFSVKDVVDVHVSAPKTSEIEVDELVIGYNGIDPSTSLSLFPGEHKEIHIELEGKALEYIGAPEGILDIYVPLDSNYDYNICNTDQDICGKVDMLPILSGAVDFLKNYKTKGDVPLSNFIEVSPVIKLDSVKRTGEYKEVTFVLSVCDTGDATALALVQQGVPDGEVKLRSRVGATSTYEVTLSQKVGGTVPTAPAPYKQTLASIIKGCEDCPEGYDEVEGGFVYAITLEDDGADQSTNVALLSGAVEGTVKKGEGQKGGTGMYTVVLSAKLTDANQETFVTANPTASVTLVGEVSSICNNATVTEVVWTKDSEVTFSSETYKLVLPDTKCGESRLAELQAFYPNNTVAETGVSGGCQREYSITVVTNTVDTQCDPIYQDIFSSNAPEPYEGVKWVSTSAAVDGTEGLYGIRIKGKVFKLATGECLRDQIGYVEDSVKIKATGGYITDFNWSKVGGEFKDNPFNVSYLSKFKPRTHVYGNALDDEERAKTFFTGRLFNYDYLGRILTGNESNIVDLNAQYVDYGVTIRREIYAQSLSQRVEETVTYHILVEVGRHEKVENLLNSLAAANGVEGVKAFPSV